MKQIDRFSKKIHEPEETISKEWLRKNLLKKSTKRLVSHPRKTPYTQETLPSTEVIASPTETPPPEASTICTPTLTPPLWIQNKHCSVKEKLLLSTKFVYTGLG